MCILAPFTLPCCRQIYVGVSRTTQCSQDWPSSKCPPEICIQIHQYEPEHRSTGICWRCQADKEGETGFVREKRRPGIDKARIAAGLEELTTAGRKKRVERWGFCWYCDARGGCLGCGSKELPRKENTTANNPLRGDACWYCTARQGCHFCILFIKDEEASPLPVSPRKRSRTNVRSRSGNIPNKRIKLEAQDNKLLMRTPASIDRDLSHRNQYNSHQSFGTDFQLCPTTSGPSGFTFGDSSTMPFYGEYEPQNYSTHMLETVSNEWHAVNQQGGGDNSYNDFPTRNVQDHEVERSNSFGFRSPMQVAQQFASPGLPFADATENHLDPSFSSPDCDQSFDDFEDTNDALLSQLLDAHNTPPLTTENLADLQLHPPPS
ncbi:hypothetical protein LOCC1_G000661 [Lachnellula occidentalis]|uniref:Uncharacterized protein n=1 Tax=Lachnellula occidentalis TaxID=215460 RepID=A0A8H8SB69_9HELO|nr:hypothetical protein LOCC1_G000661 [Lachnellula occidentalis]